MGVLVQSESLLTDNIFIKMLKDIGMVVPQKVQYKTGKSWTSYYKSLPLSTSPLPHTPVILYLLRPSKYVKYTATRIEIGETANFFFLS